MLEPMPQKMPSVSRSGAGLCLWLSLCSPTWAATVHISEILTAATATEQGIVPAYIEIFIMDLAGPFDFVVLDASPDRAWKIKSVITVTPALNVDTYILHESVWPTDALMPGAGIAIPSLGFGPFMESARTLIAYDRVTGFNTATPASVVQNFGGILAAVTFSLHGASAIGLAASNVLSMNFGDAAMRVFDGAFYTEAFTFGPIDERLRFVTGEALNPGQVNEFPQSASDDPPSPQHVPAPGAGAIVGAGLVFYVTRRKYKTTRR